METVTRVETGRRDEEDRQETPSLEREEDVPQVEEQEKISETQEDSTAPKETSAERPQLKPKEMNN